MISAFSVLMIFANGTSIIISNENFEVGFEVLTAVVLKSTIFWDITPCSPLRVNQRFGGTNHHSACHLLSRWFLAQLIFQP
jgi:hypothetical protein